MHGTLFIANLTAKSFHNFGYKTVYIYSRKCFYCSIVFVRRAISISDISDVYILEPVAHLVPSVIETIVIEGLLSRRCDSYPS